ncbi:hypothetical protein BGZ63DRAFT_376061 [Mariannaea sp. PMI_226]|nr:hypothetical protein BGZ63DRAFT_376061 [Mariannaea sp. PMI_226]
MSQEYGPFVRLWGIHPSQLPPADAKDEDLKPLLRSVLNEALPFVDLSPGEASGWKQRSHKTFPHSAAPVQMYERTVTASQLAAVVEKHQPLGVSSKSVRDETWALRQSVHENAATKGTASWAEFVRCFKEQHADAEKAFTPGVVGTRLHREWSCAGITVEGADGTIWTDLTLKSEESTHHLPAPLNKRVFPVLQVTAATVSEGRKAFLIVQIAVQPEDDEQKRTTANDSTIKAAYTSIEMVRETSGGEIEWIMGTASNAKGYLPMWMQRMAVPGQIAKDVDMFMDWVAAERQNSSSKILAGLS